MRLTLLFGLGLSFVLNSVVLRFFYPNVSTDYDEFIKFVAARNIVYEFMFATFFLLSYLLSEKLMKSVACFFMILSFGSAIDKVMGITWYLPSDVLLVVVSFLASIYLYVRESKRRD